LPFKKVAKVGVVPAGASSSFAQEEIKLIEKIKSTKRVAVFIKNI